MSGIVFAAVVAAALILGLAVCNFCWEVVRGD